MNILVFFIILIILVLIHEFGHFIAAKKSGVRVDEFGFGFPPRLFGIKIGETIYSINLIPLGGFVKLYGEEYKQLPGTTAITDKNRAFAYKKPRQKAVIIVSGVIMNFILGWALFSFLLTQGVLTPTGKVTIERVQPNSPAGAAGLSKSDVLVLIKKDGKEYMLKSSQDLVTLTKKFADEPIVLVVVSGKIKKEVTLTPRKKPPAGQGPLGIAITSSFVEKRYPWYQAPYYGLIEAFNITKHIVTELTKTLFQLTTLQKPNVEVTGPVGIARFTGEAMKFGKNAVLELMALLSLNLAVINIFPFPALDGGRLVFVFYEWTTKKRVNEKLENMLNLFGFVLLITLAAVITVNDIMKLYK